MTHAATFLTLTEKLGEGRLIKRWTNPTVLAAEVILALNHATATWPRTGWVRGDVAGDEDLRRENLALRERLVAVERDGGHLPAIAEIAGFDDEYEIEIRTLQKRETFSRTWGTIFALLGPGLLGPSYEKDVLSGLAKSLTGNNDARVSLRCTQDIRVHLMALGLIDATFRNSSNRIFVWTMTPHGKDALLRLRSIKKPGQEMDEALK